MSDQLALFGGPPTGNEPAPLLVVPDDLVCLPGDIWSLPSASGPDHRLLCGDSTDPADVARLMGDERPGMVFTDPPYNGAAGMNTSFYDSLERYARKTPDAKSFVGSALVNLNRAEWDVNFDLPAFLRSLTTVRPRNGTVYICTTEGYISAVRQWALDSGADSTRYVVWCKTNPMPSLAKRHCTMGTELIFVGTWGKHTMNFPADGHALNWWVIPTEQSNRLHPTQKPLSLVKRAIGYSSNPGDLIADFFLGSGTTLLAAEQTGRRCYGMEISQEYCRIVLARYWRATGRQPVLLERKERAA